MRSEDCAECCSGTKRLVALSDCAKLAGERLSTQTQSAYARENRRRCWAGGGAAGGGVTGCSRGEVGPIVVQVGDDGGS